jgi:hypothetical protein
MAQKVKRLTACTGPGLNPQYWGKRGIILINFIFLKGRRETDGTLYWEILPNILSSRGEIRGKERNFLIFLAILEFEPRAPQLLGRHFTT